MSVKQRVAVFGDIHGNLAALDAVIAAIEAAGIFGPYPATLGSSRKSSTSFALREMSAIY